MLLGNYSVINKLPGKFITGTSISINRSNWNNSNSSRNMFYGEANFSHFNGIPFGYGGGYAWILPKEAGGMAIVNGIIGAGEINYSNLAGGINVSSSLMGFSSFNNDIVAIGYLTNTLTGSNQFSGNIAGVLEAISNISASGDLHADLGLIIGILATLTGNSNLIGTAVGGLFGTSSLTGSSDFTSNIQGAVNLASSISGENLFNLNIVGIWDMNSSLTGLNTFSNNTLLAIGYLISSITASGNLTNLNNASPAFMSSDITSLSELSPENLANAVWLTALPGSYSTGEAGNILAQIKTLVNELHKVQGLDSDYPATTTQTSISAGDIDITITGDGETITTLTRN